MKYVFTVRGKLRHTDEKEAQKHHDAIVEKVSPMLRPMGNISHTAYLNTKNRKEFLAIDVWDNLENAIKAFSDPQFAAELAKFYDGQPDITLWAESGWKSYA